MAREPTESERRLRQQERRQGPQERRANRSDRRHEDRLAEDSAPRRNPDRPERREKQ